MRACNILQGVVLMCACAVTLAIVCEKDSCAKVECDVGVSKESCVDGEFNERGSFCGCCATCDKHLEEGESCLLQELGIQGFPLVPCKSPLSCLNGFALYLRQRQPTTRHTRDSHLGHISAIFESTRMCLKIKYLCVYQK